MINADDRRAYLRRMRADFKRRGLCMTCGSRPARIERSTCEVCFQKNSALEKRRAERLRAGRPARKTEGKVGRPSKEVPGRGRECLRCTRSAEPGPARLCADHLAVLAELDAEGWTDPPDDEEAAS